MSATSRLLRAHAKECLQNAITAKDPAQKAALLIMADAERKLASQSEDIVKSVAKDSPPQPD
jgi:hypothetical protein